VLTKAGESDILSPNEHTKYRSGVGKMLHVMQYSTHQIYNTVKDLTRHMFLPASKYMKEMLNCTKYWADRPTCGLILAPIRSWNGNSDFKFRTSGNSDSDYAQEPVDCRSVSGSLVMLGGGPVMFQSGTQKHVALSVTEAGLYVAVGTAQDMLYGKTYY
jgi:hypothetical protein